MKRSLSLTRESLTELDTADLRNVVGAALPTTPVRDCLDTLQATRCFCP